MNNSGLAVRNKLYDFIRVADDKKLFAIYHLLENEIEQTHEWWKDKTLIAELNRRYNALEKGTDKGISLSDLESNLNKLRIKRYGK